MLFLINRAQKAHLDPSEIIQTSFPLKQICLLVSLSGMLPILITYAYRQLMLLLSSRNEIHEQSHKYLSIWNIQSLIALSTIFLYFTFILCGIHPAKLPIHTLLSATYVAMSTLLPITLPTPAWGGDLMVTTVSTDSHNNKITTMKVCAAQLKGVAAYLFGPTTLVGCIDNIKQSSQHHKLQVQKMHRFSTLGTLIGICAFAILRVLDHGMQIQRHPVQIIIGATVGRICGVLLAVLWTFLEHAS